jgi:hypothetical protein
MPSEDAGIEAGVSPAVGTRWFRDSGGIRPVSLVSEVLAATLEETPKDATHWSRASMARRSGLPESTVGRIWRKKEPVCQSGSSPSPP